MILITRPQESAQNFAHVLNTLGYQTIISPTLSVTPIDFDLPDLTTYDGLVFTSTNAVRLFCESTDERDIDVFVVGEQTKQATEATGFQTIHSADGNSDDLIALIQNSKASRLLHIRGKHVMRSMKEALTHVNELIIYETVMVDHFSQEALDVLQNETLEAVTFFSKRTAESFINLIKKNDLEDQLKPIKALCISAAVLEYIQSQKWLETYTSEHLNREGMLQLVQRVCHKP